MNLQNFMSAADGLAGKLMPLAIQLASIGLLIAIFRYLYQAKISGKLDDIGGLAGALLLSASVVAYQGTIYPALKGALTSVGKVLPADNRIADALDFSEAYAKKKKETIAARAKEREKKYKDKNWVMRQVSKVKDKMSDFAEFTLDINWLSIMSNWFATGFTLGVRTCIEWLGAILLSILLAFSPVALGLSALPGFGGLRKDYLSTLIAIACWPLTMRGLDTILVQVSDAMKQHIMTGNPTGEENIEFVLIEVIICICYVMVAWITSKYTSSHSGAFLSKAAGVSALATRAAAPAAMSGAGRATQAASAMAGKGASAAIGAAKQAGAAIAGVGSGLAAIAVPTMGSGKGSMTSRAKAGFSKGYGSAMNSKFGNAMQSAQQASKAKANRFGALAYQKSKKASESFKSGMRDAERFT